MVSKYPSKKHIPISAVGGFATEKSRRWFFWALKAGKIQVPYRRTDALKHRWAIKTKDQGFTAVIGNVSPYARLVQGDKQTKMMGMIGWKTMDVVAKEETKRVQEYVYQAVTRAIGA